MARIRFKRVNEETGKEIQWENISKAYNLKGDYVVLDKEDFEEAAPEKSKVIEIDHFVNEDEIDTIYFENSYYIEPEKGGQKAYALLREALNQSGKVGIAQFVLRTAEALTVIKPMGNMIVLSKIRFAEEIRSTEDFNLPSKSEVKAAELKIALSLIKQYSKKFNINKYKDEYTAALMKVIKEKASGKHKSKVRKLKIVHSKKEDLMSQLKASLSKKAS
jgi:DNA end-binding protein Ku